MKPQQEEANQQITSLTQRNSINYVQGMENFFKVSRHFGLVSYIKDFLSISDRVRSFKTNKNFYKSMKQDHDINFCIKTAIESLKECDLDNLLLDDLFKKLEESVDQHFYINGKPIEMTEFNIKRKQIIIEHIIEYMAFIINKLVLEPESNFENISNLNHIWSKYSIINKKLKNKTNWDFYTKKCDKFGFRILSKILSMNKSLKTITVRGCKIDDTDLTHLLANLPYNSHLEKIDLMYNSITNDGVKHIANFLVSNKSLKCFNFSHNSAITAEGLLPIVNISLIENTTLDTLYLAGLGLKDEDAHLITKIFLDNRGLKKIILSHNSFTVNAIKDWKKSIVKNRCVTGIDLTANEVGAAGGAVLVDILKENSNINFLNLRACSIPASYTQLTDYVKKSNRGITVELLGN